MAAQKMTRHDMKQDDLVTAFEHARGYISKNPTTFRNAAGAVAVLVVLVLGAVFVLRSRGAAATDLLRQAQIRFGGQLVAQGARPDAPVPTYASEADRDRNALESFEQLVNRYGGRGEGRLGRYYQGILLARLGRNQEAEAALDKFLENPTSNVLTGIAKSQLAQLHAGRGDLESAAKLYSELAEDTRGTYPRDWALYYLAQTLDQQGKRPEALANYQRIVSEFPNSAMAGEATRQIGNAPKP